MYERRHYIAAGAAPALAAAAALLVMNPALAWNDRCDHTTKMEESLSSVGLKRLEVHAKAGRLEIFGRGTDRIVATGKACATTPELLQAVRWTLERSGELGILRVDLPDLPDSYDDDYARLDVTIRVPAGLDIDVTDSSGPVEIEQVGAIRLRDGAGSISIDDADGPVMLRDGAGSIELTNVRYNVDIEDGSGSLRVRDVDGNVRISDTSGSITAQRVSGSVEVDRDGSGSISVDDVGGNFVVRRDGSGSISHRQVIGEVRLPD